MLAFESMLNVYVVYRIHCTVCESMIQILRRKQDDYSYGSDSRIHPGDFHLELDYLDASCRSVRLLLGPLLEQLQERIRFQRLGGLLAGL